MDVELDPNRPRWAEDPWLNEALEKRFGLTNFLIFRMPQFLEPFAFRPKIPTRTESIHLERR